MLAWYLRRAVPWTTLLGCLALVAAVVYPAREWELFGLEGIFVYTIAGGAAGLCFDEPAIEVAAVTPRANRWALLARLTAVALPFGVACASVAAIGGPVRLRDSVLVAGGVTATVALLAAAGGRARPGAPLLAAVVLTAFVAEFIGRGSGVGSPFPNSDVVATSTLSSAQLAWWSAVVAVSVAALLFLVCAPPGARPRR